MDSQCTTEISSFLESVVNSYMKLILCGTWSFSAKQTVSQKERGTFQKSLSCITKPDQFSKAFDIKHIEAVFCHTLYCSPLLCNVTHYIAVSAPQWQSSKHISSLRLRDTVRGVVSAPNARDISQCSIAPATATIDGSQAERHFVCIHSQKEWATLYEWCFMDGRILETFEPKSDHASNWKRRTIP